ncbi:hypothetical protein D3C71_2070690 [compost metagenome]
MLPALREPPGTLGRLVPQETQVLLALRELQGTPGRLVLPETRVLLARQGSV